MQVLYNDFHKVFTLERGRTGGHYQFTGIISFAL